MKENISPEEKLLRLIRGHKKQTELKPAQDALTLHGVSPKQAAKSRSPFFSFNFKKSLGFLKLQSLAWVFFILSFGYLVASFVYPAVALKKIELPKITANKVTEIKIEQARNAKPYEFYLNAIKDKKIFGSVSVSHTEYSRGNIDADLVKDINLVGIISGENPQAVIEDKKTQKTYYVTEGQFIGEFQVQDIQDAKIIINYKGQKFELYL